MPDPQKSLPDSIREIIWKILYEPIDGPPKVSLGGMPVQFPGASEKETWYHALCLALGMHLKISNINLAGGRSFFSDPLRDDIAVANAFIKNELGFAYVTLDLLRERVGLPPLDKTRSDQARANLNTWLASVLEKGKSPGPS